MILCWIVPSSSFKYNYWLISGSIAISDRSSVCQQTWNIPNDFIFSLGILEEMWGFRTSWNHCTRSADGICSLYQSVSHALVCLLSMLQVCKENNMWFKWSVDVGGTLHVQRFMHYRVTCPLIWRSLYWRTSCLRLFLCQAI